LPEAGGSGALVWGLPALPQTLDPLTAPTPAARLISRQVYEPLVGIQHPPYGRGPDQPGIAKTVRATADRRVWRLTLRSGVRFVDGSRLTPSTVLANVRRWRTTPAGQLLLPGILTADAPSPTDVRFTLTAADPSFGARLSSPRLGIVSLAALEPRSGQHAHFLPFPEGSGSGPFLLSGRSLGSFQVTRNPRWWGTKVGLGPALDGIDFRVVADQAERVTLLKAGELQLASLGSHARREALKSPLLADVGGGLIAERSLRGLDAQYTYPALSGVWSTSLAPGP